MVNLAQDDTVVDRLGRHLAGEHQQFRLARRADAGDQLRGFRPEVQDARFAGLAVVQDDLAALEVAVGPCPFEQFRLPRTGIDQQVDEHPEAAITVNQGQVAQLLELVGIDENAPDAVGLVEPLDADAWG